MNDDLKQSVLAVSTRPEVREEIHALYADLQSEIDVRKPLCVMSGRCCRFDEFGHRLYVTTAELAAFTADLAEIVPIPALVGAQPTPGVCQFQTGKICRVHQIRPMGCRIFFCDSTATGWQQGVYERFHARLKKLHEDLAIPYAYIEWRSACQAMGWPT
jgi:Fe-S-cluster containining protein